MDRKLAYYYSLKFTHFTLKYFVFTTEKSAIYAFKQTAGGDFYKVYIIQKILFTCGPALRFYYYKILQKLHEINLTHFYFYLDHISDFKESQCRYQLHSIQL